MTVISVRLFHARESEFPNILRFCEDITKFTPHVFYGLYQILRNLRTTLVIIQTLSHTTQTTSQDSIMSPRIACFHTFEYSILFTHTTQTTTGSSTTFAHSPFCLLSTPDTMVHISESFYYAQIHTGTHSGIYPFPSFSLFISHHLKFSLDFRSIVKHTTSSPPFSKFNGTYSFLIDFFYFSFFIFISLHISLTFFLLPLCFMFQTFVLHSYLSDYSF
jgi:hypothetical protein